MPAKTAPVARAATRQSAQTIKTAPTRVRALPAEPVIGVKQVRLLGTVKPGTKSGAERVTNSAVATGPTPVAPIGPIPPTKPATRRSRSARTVAPVALGSLTQPGARSGGCCASCGSVRVTTLALILTDGTPVSFTSCHACEERSWVGPDGVLDRGTVLDRTRKIR
jgi:hypothetical protein